MFTNYPAVKLVRAVRNVIRKKKIKWNFVLKYSLPELQLNRSFQLVERNRTASKCAKVKSLVRFFFFFWYQICKFVRFSLPSSLWSLERLYVTSWTKTQGEVYPWTNPCVEPVFMGKQAHLCLGIIYACIYTYVSCENLAVHFRLSLKNITMW